MRNLFIISIAIFSCIFSHTHCMDHNNSKSLNQHFQYLNNYYTYISLPTQSQRDFESLNPYFSYYSSYAKPAKQRDASELNNQNPNSILTSISRHSNLTPIATDQLLASSLKTQLDNDVQFGCCSVISQLLQSPHSNSITSSSVVDTIANNYQRRQGQPVNLYKNI